MGFHKDNKSGILFSSTIASGTLDTSWFSLIRVVVNLELDAISSVLSGQ